MQKKNGGTKKKDKRKKERKKESVKIWNKLNGSTQKMKDKGRMEKKLKESWKNEYMWEK